MNKKSNKFPAEWSLPRLSEISKINGLAINPKKQYAEKYFFYIDIDSIENETGKIKHTKKIDIGNAPSRARRVVKHNDVIISTVRPYLKAFAIIPKENDNHICSTGFTVLSPYKSIDSKYLLYILFSRYIINQCKKMMVGAQYPALNDSQVRRIEIPLPPLPEQNKIAEILTTVDEAIEKVDEAIKKAERLKKGLMQTLLTLGIGHKEFIKTKLGQIPIDWKIVKINDVADVKGGKRLPKGNRLVDDLTQFPYIRVVDFKNMKVDQNNIKYLDMDTHKKIKNYTISSDDVYISIAGTVGLSGNIPTILNGANLTENAAKLCNLRNIAKTYLAYVLNSKIGQNQIKSFVGRAQQPKLALFRIEKIKLPLPPLPEQKKIAEILSSADQKLELMRERKCKLNRVKKGLMHDLLTGRKRVRLDG